jgi:hypothetical protein
MECDSDFDVSTSRLRLLWNSTDPCINNTLFVVPFSLPLPSSPLIDPGMHFYVENAVYFLGFFHWFLPDFLRRYRLFTMFAGFALV